MQKLLVVALSCAMISGCASRASDISASYVSPILYQNLTCSQLALEAQNVSARAVAATGVQNRKAGNDAVAMTVGLVVFWPALFFMSGDGVEAAELSRLKGEMQAIESASIRQGCGIQFDRGPSSAQVVSAPRAASAVRVQPAAYSQAARRVTPAPTPSLGSPPGGGVVTQRW